MVRPCSVALCVAKLKTREGIADQRLSDLRISEQVAAGRFLALRLTLILIRPLPPHEYDWCPALQATSVILRCSCSPVLVSS